ncbi:hypothetical protein [Terriglobus sp. RCC_193]|uniref:hypothetical protein n=1 Tax=Terriglobus sp. RCC_193 TaxID=3239218 RepID=UPI0035238FBA
MNLAGTLSRKSMDVNVMLCAAGLPHRLGVQSTEVPEELRETYTTFEMRNGTGSHPESAKQRDRCGTELTEYIDECLQKQGFNLSDDGKYQVACLLTEVIGNAEEHGGPWHATGFWNGAKMQTERGFAGEVHLLIYNDGRTIYEALQHKDLSSEMNIRLKTLSRIHERAYAASNGLWDEETCWTLYALQDQVSRYTGSPRGTNRGNGTIKMIDFFNGLAAKDRKKMCIVSGGAYILLDGTYSLQTADKGLQKIAFNSSNSLVKRPDVKYVRTLKKRFPGTIVSIRLVLDAVFLEQIFIGPQPQKV